MYDAALDHDPPYLAMAYVEGQSLRELLREAGALTVEHTARLLRPVASALDHCHANGQTHRDIKPANILLGHRGGQEWPVLTDFGIVRAAGSADLTATGLVLGTVAYLSPEQARGEYAGASSDLYAFACVAFECVTGLPPFRGGGDLDILMAHRDHAPPLASALLPRLGPGVDGVFVAALDKDREARMRAFPTVTAFVDALAAAGSGGGWAPGPRGSSGSAAARTAVLSAASLGMGGVSAAAAAPSQAADPLGAPRESAEVPAASPRTRGAWVAAAVVAALVGMPAAYVGADALVDRPEEDSIIEGPPERDPVDEVIKPGEVLTQAQRDLLRQGPLPHLENCVPQPSVEQPPTTAAVGCDATFPGVDSLLLRQSEAGAALTAHMDSPARPPGRCRQQVGVDSTWDHGPLACYDNTSGVAAVWWGYADSGLNYVAVRNDGENGPLLDWFLETSWSSPTGPPG